MDVIFLNASYKYVSSLSDYYWKLYLGTSKKNDKCVASAFHQQMKINLNARTYAKGYTIGLTPTSKKIINLAGMHYYFVQEGGSWYN